jgi:DNA polymerase III gamma/tau subunit
VLVESAKVNRARIATLEGDKKAEQLQKTFNGLESAELKASVREKETKMYLDMQVEQNRELEARLEQALRRWKVEKETGTYAPSNSYSKTNSNLYSNSNPNPNFKPNTKHNINPNSNSNPNPNPNPNPKKVHLRPINTSKCGPLPHHW